MFTRQPDYFDSERTNGTVITRQDQLVVAFQHDNKIFYAAVPYRFMHQAGEKAAVIYETADPSHASIYAIVGYWIMFGELAASLFIVVVLYWISVSVTSNPTPEALIEELEMGKKKPRKPKYDG